MSRRLWVVAGCAGVALLFGTVFILRQDPPGRTPAAVSSRVMAELPAHLPNPESLGIVLPAEPVSEPVSPAPKPAERSGSVSAPPDEIKRLEQKGILTY